MKTVQSFFANQIVRLRLRVWLVLHGISAAVFWTLFFVVWTLLTNVGLAWVGWALLASYAVVASPFLILQVVLIADLFALVVIGRTFAYSTIEKLKADFARDNPEKVSEVSWRLQVLFFLADASPFSSMSMWSLVVLTRLPVDAHGKTPVGDLKRHEIAMERAVFASATARLRLVPA